MRMNYYFPAFTAFRKQWLTATLLCVLGVLCFNLSYADGEKPNIILVLIDDLGYGELETYGNTFNETPNITKLAEEGMMFTDAYASGPVCSPSRASIQTGQYTPRHGIYDYLSENSDNYLSPGNHITINEALKNAGYYTGLIGKWHLDTDFEDNPGSPLAHGYDEVIATETKYIAGGDYFYPYDKVSTLTTGEANEFLPDRLFQEANEFVEKNNGKPFYLAVQLYSVHMTLDGPEELVNKYKAKYEDKHGEGTSSYFDSSSPRHAGKPDNPYMAAMLERIDAGVGNLVNKLEELGIDDNTMIVVTSDNGGDEYVANNGGLRGAKTWLYEGGIKIPLIIRYPDGCPADEVNTTPVSFVDFYPTFLELAGGETSQLLDGESIVPLFKGDDMGRDEIYWYYPAGAKDWNDRKACALRKGDYKLIYKYAISPESYELYNLVEDPYEENNLYTAEAAKANELKNSLDAWMEEMGLQKWHLSKDSIYDFESEFYGNYGTKGNLTGPPNTGSELEDTTHTYFTAVENPSPDELNSTETVGKFHRLKTGYWWAYAWFDFEPVYIAATESTPKYLHVLVRKPLSSKVCVQLKGENNSTSSEIIRLNSETNKWEDLVFEIKNPGWYSAMELKADFENSANPPYPARLSEDIDIYFDEIIINDDPYARGGDGQTGFEEKNIIDFETGFTSNWGTNGNPNGLTEDHDAFQIIENPLKTELNPTSKVGLFNRKREGKWWAYSWFGFDTVQVHDVPVYLHVLVNKPVISTVCAQLKDRHSSPENNTGEIKNNNQSYTNNWEDLVFEINTPGNYSYFEFKPDFINENPLQRLEQDIDIFFDEVIINTDPTPRHLLTSVEIDDISPEISVFPTVTHDYINIRQDKTTTLRAHIYNMEGALLFKKTYFGTNSGQINLTEFDAGIYILKLWNQQLSTSFKIIKM